MNRFSSFPAITILAAVMFFMSAAQAMDIRQFEKMALQDQHDYIVDLVVGAQKVLIYEGRKDQADQVDKLFTEMPAGDDAPLGVTEIRKLNLSFLVVI